MNHDYRKTPVTMMMLVICVVVYLYTSLTYSFDMNALEGILSGALNPILVVQFQQYYRLITANFIHFGMMHIVCNGYSLYNVGRIMEQLLGGMRYALVLIGSMLFTTVIPVLLYVIFEINGDMIMAGFSGAIFGLIGALLALAIWFKDIYMYLFKQIASSVGLMLLLSILVPSISFIGHISGLIGGFVVMVGIIYFYPLPAWKRKESEVHNLVN